MENTDPYQPLLAAMREQELEDQLFLSEAYETLSELNLYNSLYAELVVELAEDLSSIVLSRASDTLAEMELDEEYGRGINMYQVIGALDDYDTDDDPTSLDVALYYIMREKERRILCEE